MKLRTAYTDTFKKLCAFFTWMHNNTPDCRMLHKESCIPNHWIFVGILQSVAWVDEVETSNFNISKREI